MYGLSVMTRPGSSSGGGGRVTRALPALAVLSALLWGGSGGSAVLAEVTAASGNWLERIHHAARELNYRGTFVYRSGVHIESLRIVHRVSDGEVRERLYSLSGSPREIIRDRDNVWCYVPEQNAGFKHYRQLAKGGFPALPPHDLAHIGKFYALDSGGLDRIAGHEARRLSLIPQDGYRYGYMLWPHLDTGLLLRMDLLDEAGQSMEAYMFASIDINAPIAEDELLPETPDEDLVWVDTAAADDAVGGLGEAGPEGSQLRWQVTRMPPGFRLSRGIHRRSPVNAVMMDHLVLSDGLAVVSVFIEPLKHSAKRVRGLNRMGAVHAYGRVAEDQQVTVIGEAPAVTVRMIGDSVARAARQTAEQQ